MPVTRFLFAVAFVIMLPSCIKSYHEDRLGEEVWEVGYTDIAICDKAVSEGECVNKLKPTISTRGQELCGHRLKAKVGDCKKTQRKGLYAVVCQVTCEEAQIAKRSIPVRIAEGGSTSYEESIGQLRVILNSHQIKSLLAGRGIAMLVRAKDDSYVVVGHGKEVCIKAQIRIDVSGEYSLKQATPTSCESLQ